MEDEHGDQYYDEEQDEQMYEDEEGIQKKSKYFYSFIFISTNLKRL